jgi:hypothetical protein
MAASAAIDQTNFQRDHLRFAPSMINASPPKGVPQTPHSSQFTSSRFALPLPISRQY